MVAFLRGRIDWGMDKDQDGHRDYFIEWLVQAHHTHDGPQTIEATPGLPAPGSIWAFGNDLDPYAFCWPDWSINPILKTERGRYWSVRQKFSTRPLRRCQDTPIENPLDEPPRIGGSFAKWTEEAEFDRHGNPIISSSQERLPVEFDANAPTVSVEYNSLYLPLDTLAMMVDTVNEDPMWGLDSRMVKLSNAWWQRALYGTCSYFYIIGLEFEVNYRTWDKVITDRGTRVLKGTAPGSRHKVALNPDDPDPDLPGKKIYQNPKNYEAYKDVNSDAAIAFLDGKGRPAFTVEPARITVEKYHESNFFELEGTPVAF